MKTATTRIRLTEKERTDLDSLAKRMQISRSELIRQFIHAGLEKNTSAKIMKWDNDTISVIRDYNMLLSKIGLNINQIARKCNAGNPYSTLANEVQTMQHLLDQLKKEMINCL